MPNKKRNHAAQWLESMLSAWIYNSKRQPHRGHRGKGVMSTTPEEARAEGQLNASLENNLSSVRITHKVEMKTGKSFTEWEIKAKHEDVDKAKSEAIRIDEELRQKYGTS